MRFVVLDNDFPLEKIKFLQGKYKPVSSPYEEELVYEVDEKFREKLKVLEEAGLIREIKKEFKEIERVEDLYALTEKVELLQGGSAYMRVWIRGHIFSFTENQLFYPHALMKQLLRLKKIIAVKKSEWIELLQYWFNIAEELEEPSEEEEIVEKVLNYLTDCRIFKEKELAVTPFSLYYTEETPDRVYCCIDILVERIGYENRRRLRTLLSDYILVNSLQFMIHHQRRRFWAFSIERCGIELKRQEYEREEVEEKEGDEKRVEKTNEVGEICGEDNRSSGYWEND